MPNEPSKMFKSIPHEDLDNTPYQSFLGLPLGSFFAQPAIFVNPNILVAVMCKTGEDRARHVLANGDVDTHFERKMGDMNVKLVMFDRSKILSNTCDE
jgi:hypothetical protein